MVADPERSARIIERRVVGDGSRSDEQLCILAAEVRTMEADPVAIASWVRFQARLELIDSDTIEGIAVAVEVNAEAD